MPNLFKGQQGAGAGSVHIAAAFAVAGALTFAFQSLCTHVLGKQGFAPLALLWSATFLTVQVLWIGATQTLGRYVAEREAQGKDWDQVVSSVRRWQIGLVVAFVLCAVLAGPLLTNELFEDPWLTVAFIVAVVLYAPEYFRRGIFNGHRQSFRLGAQIVVESSGRVLIAAALLVVGWGVFGPVIAIVLAPQHDGDDRSEDTPSHDEQRGGDEHPAGRLDHDLGAEPKRLPVPVEDAAPEVFRRVEDHGDDECDGKPRVFE